MCIPFNYSRTIIGTYCSEIKNYYFFQIRTKLLNLHSITGVGGVPNINKCPRATSWINSMISKTKTFINTFYNFIVFYRW